MSSKSAAATLVLNGGSVGGSAGVGGGSSGASTASSCLDKDVNEYSELLSYEQEVGMVSHLELGGGGGGGAGCPSPSLNKDPVISAGRHQPPPPTLRLFGASSKGPPSASPTSPPPLPVKLGIMGQKGAGRKPQVTNGSSRLLFDALNMAIGTIEEPLIFIRLAVLTEKARPLPTLLPASRPIGSNCRAICQKTSSATCSRRRRASATRPGERCWNIPME